MEEQTEHWIYNVPEKPCNRNLIDRSLDLYRNDFDHAGLGTANLISILKQSRRDLSGCNLSGLDLRKAVLNGTRLFEEDLVATLDHSYVCDSTFLSATQLFIAENPTKKGMRGSIPKGGICAMSYTTAFIYPCMDDRHVLIAGEQTSILYNFSSETVEHIFQLGDAKGMPDFYPPFSKRCFIKKWEGCYLIDFIYGCIKPLPVSLGYFDLVIHGTKDEDDTLGIYRGRSNTIEFINIETGEVNKTIELDFGRLPHVSNAAFSYSRRFLALCFHDGQYGVLLVDLSNNRTKQLLTNASIEIYNCTFSLDSRYLITTDKYGNAFYYKLGEADSILHQLDDKMLPLYALGGGFCITQGKELVLIDSDQLAVFEKNGTIQQNLPSESEQENENGWERLWPGSVYNFNTNILIASFRSADGHYICTFDAHSKKLISAKLVYRYDYDSIVTRIDFEDHGHEVVLQTKCAKQYFKILNNNRVVYVNSVPLNPDDKSLPLFEDKESLTVPFGYASITIHDQKQYQKVCNFLNRYSLDNEQFTEEGFLNKINHVYCNATATDIYEMNAVTDRNANTLVISAQVRFKTTEAKPIDEVKEVYFTYKANEINNDRNFSDNGTFAMNPFSDLIGMFLLGPEHRILNVIRDGVVLIDFDRGAYGTLFKTENTFLECAAFSEKDQCLLISTNDGYVYILFIDKFTSTEDLSRISCPVVSFKPEDQIYVKGVNFGNIHSQSSLSPYLQSELRLYGAVGLKAL
ncbi:MAG: hypothetical protein VZT48_00475 [Bulleidia sp.]|nr:hypothetical protein [Bulleidia sp.]